MTFIKPNKNHSLLNKVLAILVVFVMIGVFWLVTIYNNYVNLSHGLADMRAEFQVVQADNVVLQNRIFDLVNSDSVKALAEGGSLVQDKNPSYLEIDATTGSSVFRVGEAKLLSRFP